MLTEAALAGKKTERFDMLNIPNRGLLSLPDPRSGDLFFDIEGDPYAYDDGIEYLFGVLEPGLPDADGNATFHAFWARDAAGGVTRDAEKLAFEQLVDFFDGELARIVRPAGGRQVSHD